MESRPFKQPDKTARKKRSEDDVSQFETNIRSDRAHGNPFGAAVLDEPPIQGEKTTQRRKQYSLPRTSAQKLPAGTPLMGASAEGISGQRDRSPQSHEIPQWVSRYTDLNQRAPSRRNNLESSQQHPFQRNFLTQNHTCDDGDDEKFLAAQHHDRSVDLVP